MSSPLRRAGALLVGVLLLAGCTTSAQDAGATTSQGARSTRSTGGSSSSTGSGLTPGQTDPTSGLRVVALSSLPPQATTTYRLIVAGGPFPYRQDGVVYHNNNGVLPKHPDGYYHEYTVKTPGASTRGARRIIHGNGPEYYWTADHYNSFQRIA